MCKKCDCLVGSFSLQSTAFMIIIHLRGRRGGGGSSWFCKPLPASIFFMSVSTSFKQKYGEGD